MTLNAFDWAIIGVYLMGMIAGFGVNLLLWRFAPEVSWLWWNVIGFVVACGAGCFISLAFARPHPDRLKNTLFQLTSKEAKTWQSRWWPQYITLALYGSAILLLLVFLTYR